MLFIFSGSMVLSSLTATAVGTWTLSGARDAAIGSRVVSAAIPSKNGRLVSATEVSFGPMPSPDAGSMAPNTTAGEQYAYCPMRMRSTACGSTQSTEAYRPASPRFSRCVIHPTAGAPFCITPGAVGISLACS